MHVTVKKLAEQAGFMLWEDEQWNPGDTVDWAARYDLELEQFYNLVLQQAAEACRRTGTLEQDTATGEMYADAVRELLTKIDQDDKIK